VTKAQPVGGAEYTLFVTPHVNERSQKPTTLVVLRTAASFASFRYLLAVDARLDGATIRLKVLGLQAPRMNLPGAGPAEFREEFENLDGDYRIIVQGLDDSSTEVAVRIAPGRVTLTEPLHGGIVAVETHNPPP